MNRLLPTLLIPFAAFLLMLPPAAQAARPPLVLAFYYDWFDANTWTPAKVPDMPATLYNSNDPAAIARQIQQARGAGIDAFVVSWWGAGNPTDDNFKIMLDQAHAANFQVAVDFELTSPFYHTKQDAINSLKNLLASNAQHPAYLRSGGKPVIFFWREQMYTPDEWRDIRNTVDPNRQSLWIAEGVKEQLPYLSVFDGFHLYSIAWAPDVTAELNKWPARVRAYGPDKIWTATVMPGNDDTRTHRAGSYVRDRRNGDFYRETWRAAFTTYPDWVIVTSWNEWVEGTMIEPSATYGNLYLDITRDLASQFKAGLPTPTLVPTRTPSPTPTVTLTPAATITPSAAIMIPGAVTATIDATDTVRVRAEPSTEGTILGRLRPGAIVSLLAQSEDAGWWQIAYPDAKQRGWIAAQFINAGSVANLVPTVSPTATLTPDPTPTAADTSTPFPTDTPTLEPTLPPVTSTPSPTQSPGGFGLPSFQDIFGWLPFH
ncbi:MAG TPA: endo-1,3-alpha-glucanase family glycosylhydrolase [Anaerolineae bacterium]